MYCFIGLEFTHEDYEIMDFWTSQSRESCFTYQFVAVKMILTEKVVGELNLAGSDVKRMVKGKTEPSRTRKTEERAQGLEDVFGLKLADEERNGINEIVTELGG